MALIMPSQDKNAVASSPVESKDEPGPKRERKGEFHVQIMLDVHLIDIYHTNLSFNVFARINTVRLMLYVVCSY